MDNRDGTHIYQKAVVFHREEVTPVVRCLLNSLVMGRRGLELLLHIFSTMRMTCMRLQPGNSLASASCDQSIRVFNIHYSLHEGMGYPTWICYTSYPIIQSLRPDASLILCHQTALARRPVHPILIWKARSSFGTSPLRQ